MQGRLYKLTGLLLAVLLCVTLAAPAAAAQPDDNTIASAALQLISSHEGTYNSVNAADSGAVSVGMIQWHGNRALEVVRLAAQYLGADNAIAILGQDFYNEIMMPASWETRTVNATEAAALRQLLSTDAGHRAEDEIGTRDLANYVKRGKNHGLTDPATLVYYCDLTNQWPVQADKIAAETVSTYGAAATVDKIHTVASASPMAGPLRDNAFQFCVALNWGTVSPLTSSPHFKDVASDAWYASSVSWAVEHGITDGTSSGVFSPDSVCTRGQAVTMLWRAMGSPEAGDFVTQFSDVSSSDYYYKAVIWAAANDITSGTGNNMFSPNRPCTRGEIVTFLWRVEGCPAVNGVSFSDVALNSYCGPAVGWAYSKGITDGTGNGCFSPDGACTRAHIVTFLHRDMA